MGWPPCASEAACIHLRFRGPMGFNVPIRYVERDSLQVEDRAGERRIGMGNGGWVMGTQEIRERKGSGRRFSIAVMEARENGEYFWGSSVESRHLDRIAALKSGPISDCALNALFILYPQLRSVSHLSTLLQHLPSHRLLDNIPAKLSVRIRPRGHLPCNIVAVPPAHLEVSARCFF